MSDSTQVPYSNTQEHLFLILQSEPSEMVRRHLLNLAGRLLKDKNQTAFKQVIARLGEGSSTESKPQPLTQLSTVTSLLTDALKSPHCVKAEASRDGSSVLVFLRFAETAT